MQTRYLIGLSVFSPLFLSVSALAGTSTPQSLPSISDLPACYLKTRSGQIIDLTAKCGFIKPVACASSLGSPSRDKVLVDFCKKNEKCLLTNTCGDLPRGVNMPPPGTPMGFGFPKQIAV